VSYAGVMLLSKEKPKLLPLVVAAHEIVLAHGNQFSASSVLNRAPNIAPNLVTLRRRGIVTKTGGSRQGHRSFYELADPPGVARALQELRLAS
jgi:hypothetical protein